MGWLIHGWSFLFLAGYLVLIYRIYSRKKQEVSSYTALIYAWFCAIGKFAQAQGQITFYLAKLRQQQNTLIEYKPFS